MPTPTSFTLPETQRAFEQWSAITRLDWDSPEWGEVWQTLDDCGLLIADRLPQRALFDLPETRLGDTSKVVHLRTAVVAGALLYTEDTVADPATGTEIVAALLTCLYGRSSTPAYGELLTHLARDLPTRRLALHDSPSAALISRWQDGETPDDTTQGLAAIVLRVALHDDRIAEEVFARLSADPAWATALVHLSSGRWLTYRCDQHPENGPYESR